MDAISVAAVSIVFLSLRYNLHRRLLLRFSVVASKLRIGVAVIAKTAIGIDCQGPNILFLENATNQEIKNFLLCHCPKIANLLGKFLIK